MLKKAILLVLSLSLLLTCAFLLSACKDEEPTPPGGSVTPPASDEGGSNGGETETDTVFDWDFFSDNKNQVRAKLTDDETAALLAQDALRWEMDENGTLTIKGICVTAPTFTSAADQPWIKFSEEQRADAADGRPAIKKVVIDPTVMVLPAYAFQNCTDLVSVSLPVTLSALPEYCFADCEKLTTVTGSAGLSDIGEYAFSDCSALERLEVSASFSSVGYAAFSGACDALGQGKTLHLQIRGTEDTWLASKETMAVNDVGTSAFKNATPLYVS